MEFDYQYQYKNALMLPSLGLYNVANSIRHRLLATSSIG